MPVAATLVCLNVSQSIVCINKSSLHIVLMCPNVPLDKALAKWDLFQIILKMMTSKYNS